MDWNSAEFDLEFNFVFVLFLFVFVVINGFASVCEAQLRLCIIPRKYKNKNFFDTPVHTSIIGHSFYPQIIHHSIYALDIRHPVFSSIVRLLGITEEKLVVIYFGILIFLENLKATQNI